MVTNLYDPDFVARYFDDFGEREWTRLVNTPADEIKLHIHSHYLRQYIEKDNLVLDIGAGAGRFTQILIELGATVVVADISKHQLELNKRFARDFAFAHGVRDWLKLDMCDMSVFSDHSFDSVVCYGSPLGYVFEKRDGWSEPLSKLRVDTARWNELLAMELEACREPGCLDMGTHLIAVIEKQEET